MHAGQHVLGDVDCEHGRGVTESFGDDLDRNAGGGECPRFRATGSIGRAHVSTNNFDERAATWDDPAKIDQAEKVAMAIRQTVPLDKSMHFLEYGAGTGLVTKALRDAVGPVTMADTSAGMRAVMNEKVAAGTITDARVWDLDLTSDPVPDQRFDLIVTVLTLHHIPSVEPVLSSFAELLIDGGYLCIADLEQEDGSFHGADFDGHHGFKQSELRSLLERAGFVDISFQHCYQIARGAGTYPVFLATCVCRRRGAHRTAEESKA